MSKTTATKPTAKPTASPTEKSNAPGKSNKQGGKSKIIEASQFNITKFSFTEIDVSDPKPRPGQKTAAPRNQYTAYMRYNFGTPATPDEQQLTVKTKPIKFVQGGIPRLSEFIPNDKKRDYFRIPYDPTQPACVELFKVFEAIDAYFMKNKDKMLMANEKTKKTASKYVYTKIVREPQERDDDDGKKSNNASQPRMKYAKVKLVTDFESGDVRTHVFSRDNERGLPEPVKSIKTVTDLADNHFTWMSTDQFVLNGSKAWFNKSGDENGVRKCGVTFKCPQMEIVERSSSQKRDVSEYAFGTDDMTVPASKPTPAPAEESAEDGVEEPAADDQPAEEAAAEENGEVEEEVAAEEEEAAEEPEPEPVKPAPKKPAAKKATPPTKKAGK